MMLLRKTVLFAMLGWLALSDCLGAEVIKDIRIENQHGESYDLSSVEAFTSFQIGEEVGTRETILSSIATDVSRMRESGRFSYVNARMDVEADGVVLVYTVVSKNRLRRIEFAGADKMSHRKVRTKSELEIGQFADDSTFAQAARKIEETYREFWYPDAEVKWEAKTDDILGVVDVVFTIDEGDRLAINRIDFSGNESIEDEALRKVMQQKQKHWFPFWSRLTGSGKYRPEMEDMDLFSIKQLYMNEGFLDAQVTNPVIDARNRRRAKMTIHIAEGQRYRVGEVTLSGVTLFEEKLVRRGMVLSRGDIASYSDVEAASESIRAYYGDRGYIRTSVMPILDADASQGIVDIRFEVVEGKIGYINRVNIRGNERTRDKVIRREMTIYPGDKYSRSRVRTSENRLQNLGYFEAVTSSVDETAMSERYDLNLRVREKPTGQFSAGVGFSSVDSLVGYIELSQGNFDLKRWPPIGGGQKFKIRAQLGTRRNDLDISFVEPWFLDRKLSFGIDLYHREARYFSDNYDQKNDGMRLTLGKPLSRYIRGSIAYTLEQFHVFDVADSASIAIKEEEGRRLKSGLDFTLTRDTRDRFFNPTRGSRTTITPYFAGGPLGAETDIYGGRIRSTHYWPLFNDHVFNIRGQLETVEAYGDSKDAAKTGDGVPIFDRLFLGGSYTLRGFEFREVGPYDSMTDDYLGGNSMGFITLEYTVPLWSKIRGACFYDAGFVNKESLDFDPRDFNSNWGIGLRFDLPGFPLHLDYAFPLESEDHNDSSGRFNFLIGHTF
jgi:outer membrane protein insertion porin family